MKYNTIAITKNALFGEAVGDAFGVPVEFMSRKEVRKVNLDDMLGCDKELNFQSRWGDVIPSGAWSDDTSMTIAAMTSIANNNGQINADDIMTQFLNWWNYGIYSSLSFPFGLGEVISRSFNNFYLGHPAELCGPSGFRDNGNGALMRILPFSLYCIFNDLSMDKTVSTISLASSITHGHDISKLGCIIFSVFLKQLIKNNTVADAWKATRTQNYSAYFSPEIVDTYSHLLSHNFDSYPEEYIGETGYVVDTLTIAVYSMIHSDNYEQSIKTAINMGYDTDTSGAVTGALAGAFYGVQEIPQKWYNSLRKKELLETTSQRFAKCFM